MKNILRALSIIIVSLSFTFAFTITTYATENNSVDYVDFFEQAMTVPVKEEEAYIARLEELFAADKAAFLDALAGMDKNTIEVVVFTWSTGKTYDEICDLRDIVMNADKDSKYAPIVAALNSEIGLMQYIDIMEPYMQYENPDTPFSVPLLRRFIDLNIENETFDTDEEFNQMLALAYEASPVTIAEILCGYTAPNIENLAKCIAADCRKYNRSIPSPGYDDQPEEIAEIIRIIQSKIHNAVNTQPSNDEIIGNDSTRTTDTHSVILVIAFVCLLTLILIATVLKKQETY